MKPPRPNKGVVVVGTSLPRKIRGQEQKNILEDSPMVWVKTGFF